MIIPKLQKKDFIEIEFTGRIKGGEIFDSNIEENIKKISPESKIKAKPLVFSLGEGMFLNGVDEFLIGKPAEKKDYEVEIFPDKAFGQRDSKLVQMMPMKIFIEHKLNPIPGTMLNFDGRIAKVLTASSGRVMVDFNNPLAGKIVIYNIKLLRKIDDINEKINALTDFLFKMDFKFEVKDKEIILEAEKQLVKFVEMFKDKFKDILGMELNVKEAEEVADKKEDNHKILQ